MPTDRPRKTSSVSIDITPADRERVQRAADAIGLSVAALGRVLLLEHVNRVDAGERRTFSEGRP